MHSIYSVTTYHLRKRADEAAEAWKQNGVCAIGWADDGDLRKIPRDELYKAQQSFLEIHRNDFILAYALGNRIAYVGDVKGPYNHSKRNIVGKPARLGGFNYPNQFRVKWRDEPYDFSRNDLPVDFAKQLGKRRQTIVRLDIGRRTFDEAKSLILKDAQSGSLTYINEDTIKFGIWKYVYSHLKQLKRGLRIVKAENPISESDRPDFLAEDGRKRVVIIECKGTATAAAVTQLERYGKTYRASRLMLVAFRMTSDCLKKARMNPRLELFECELEFHPR